MQLKEFFNWINISAIPFVIKALHCYITQLGGVKYYVHRLNYTSSVSGVLTPFNNTISYVKKLMFSRN